MADTFALSWHEKKTANADRWLEGMKSSSMSGKGGGKGGGRRQGHGTRRRQGVLVGGELEKRALA